MVTSEIQVRLAAPCDAGWAKPMPAKNSIKAVVSFLIIRLPVKTFFRVSVFPPCAHLGCGLEVFCLVPERLQIDEPRLHQGYEEKVQEVPRTGAGRISRRSAPSSRILSRRPQFPRKTWVRAARAGSGFSVSIGTACGT